MDDIVSWISSWLVRSAGIPQRPKAAVRGALHPGDTLEDAPVVGILWPRLLVAQWRNQGRIALLCVRR
jgi:hypothetical protein